MTEHTIKNHAKSALTNADINALIRSNVYMGEPELKRAVIKVCEKRRHYAGIHIMADLGHMNRQDAHLIMAEWAFKDNDLDLCTKKLGKKCGHVRQTRRSLAMYMVCEDKPKNPIRSLKTRIMRGNDFIRQEALSRKIIKPNRMEHGVAKMLHRYAGRDSLARVLTASRPKLVQG
jgi:hypothetical protein